MTDSLSALLALVDDPNPVVSQEVTRALENVPDLKARLEPLEPSPSQRRHLQLKLQRKCESELVERWLDWPQGLEPYQRLERGLEALCEYQSGFLFSARLSQLLDRIAADFEGHTPRELAGYLFHSRLGPDHESYYCAENSNLVDVWYRGLGIPISLACIYVLVGRRLGLRVDWCNFPGHFLARFYEGDQVYFVDCYHHGQVMDQALNEQLRGRVPVHRLLPALHERATADQVLARFLRNLINAYQQQESPRKANLMRFLLKMTELGDRELRPPIFQPGEVVVDDKAGYRGVVVDYDLKYRPRFSNATGDPEPSPYYLILVDGSSAISYSRESRLNPDGSGREVHHPFLPYFFNGFEGGIYLRNNLPWPS